MLNDSHMKVFPELIGAENAGLAQLWAVYSFDTWPSHDFSCCEAFYKST